MQDLIPINIVIGDRNYRVKIQAADEEKVRALIKMVNEKILDFKQHFAGKDMQDFIAMALLWFVTEQRSSGNRAEMTGLITGLQQLESLLDSVSDP